MPLTAPACCRPPEQALNGSVQLERSHKAGLERELQACRVDKAQLQAVLTQRQELLAGAVRGGQRALLEHGG